MPSVPFAPVTEKTPGSPLQHAADHGLRQPPTTEALLPATESRLQRCLARCLTRIRCTLGESAKRARHAVETRRLARAQLSFEATLDGLPTEWRQRLREPIRSAQSLSDLWNLRPQLFNALAHRFTQDVAQERLQALDGHFPRRMGIGRKHLRP